MSSILLIGTEFATGHEPPLPLARRPSDRDFDARTHDTHDLRLNDVAREAGVGVGTVYRRFPNVHALVEALSSDTIGRMLDVSRRAASEPDPAEAFSLYLRSALALQLEDGGLQAVLLSPADESAEVRSAKQEIFATFSAVLDRAQFAGAVRAGITLEQLSHLVCGVEYAVRLGSPDDRALLLEILLSGLRPAA